MSLSSNSTQPCVSALQILKMGRVGIPPDALKIDSGEKRLNELGYKQELKREMVIFPFICFFFSFLQIYHVKRCTVIRIYICKYRLWMRNSLFVPWLLAEFIQDTCNNIFNRGTFRGNATLRAKLALCRTRNLDMGMGCSHILHLLCRSCLG